MPIICVSLQRNVAQHFNSIVMVYSTKFGVINCTYKKCLLNGRRLNKRSLLSLMEKLDFDKFHSYCAYAFYRCDYSEVYSRLVKFLDEEYCNSCDKES